MAEALSALSQSDLVIAFRVLPRRFASDVFEYFPAALQEALVKTMGQEDVAAVLNHMSPDDRTLLFGELPANVTKHLLSLLTPVERAEAVTLLGYEPGTIGRLMTPHYIAVREDWTVQQVMDYVRTHGQDSETLNVIYVVDEHGLLIDDIRMREFLVVPLTRHVSDLMDRRFVALRATDAQDAAVEVFKREDRTALPVTDTQGVLIGIVTVDDALDVAERRATREMQRVGGSEALDEPYMDIALGRMVKKRAGWLVVLFLGEMLTATAMGFFEHEIARAVVLALFVPLIISSGGNSGSQASTLVIRAMARRRTATEGLVARHPARGGVRAAARRHPRHDRVPADQHLVDVLDAVRPALGAGGHDGRPGAGGDRAVGHAGGIDAAADPAPAGIRSGHIVGAVRGDARGRDRPGDLLLGRARRPQGHPAVVDRRYT